MTKGLVVLPFALAAALAHAGYFTAATGLVGTHMHHPTAKVGHDYGAKLTSSIDLSTSETSSDHGDFDFASSSFRVLTEMGRIHAKAETYAMHGYTGEQGQGGGSAFVFDNSADFGQSGPLPGDNFAGGYWEDVLHVRSSTLAAGTRVQFLLHMTFEGAMDSYAPLSQNKTRASLTTRFASDTLNLNLSEGSNLLTTDRVVTVYVGDDVPMQSKLNVLAQTSYTLRGEASHANVDTWNTGIFSLESLTPGVTYTTDSGYMYGPQAVPEPASLAALGLGALGIVRRRRFARRSRN